MRDLLIPANSRDFSALMGIWVARFEHSGFFDILRDILNEDLSPSWGQQILLDRVEGYGVYLGPFVNLFGWDAS